MAADPCAPGEAPSTRGDATFAPCRTERLRTGSSDLARAVDLLRGGRLVAFPTETVYGLGADGRDPAAVAALYAAKGRPRFNPLIAHLPGLDAARREGWFGPDALRLAEAFWPGPLTLVVPLADRATTCDLARAGLGSVALRVPAHPLASELVRAAGRPVVAPSANRSGRVSPTQADHVLADLDGRIDAVLDGGPCPLGVESTIVACLAGVPSLLRPGGLAREAIEAVLGGRLARPDADPARPLAPGGLASHYAPRAAVRMNAREVRDGEAALLFGRRQLGHRMPARIRRAVETLNLSPDGDLREAAANLFGHLRRLDATGAASIAVMPIPHLGLGEAINDRLRRAAADR